MQGTYYIVASHSIEAEEIAYECIAANFSDDRDPELLASFGRSVAKVGVQESQAAETICNHSGLIGSGDPAYNERAYAAYVDSM